MSRGESTRRRESLRLLYQKGRPYRGALFAGALFSLGVVVTRLALPWPLRGLMEAVFRPDSAQPGSLIGAAQALGEPVLVFCGGYLLLSVASGLFEMMQRVRMARFASRTAHDLRAAAVASVVAEPAATDASGADLVTRIIGDSARVKANLQGILVHVTQNGLLLAGVTLMFLFIAPKLGLLFLAGVGVAVLIGMLTVDEVEQTALKQRHKESRYAARIHEDDRPVSEEEAQILNASSARKDVRTTRLIGRATLWAHTAVALVISYALWVGAADVRSGNLAPGELFLFVAYALMVHRRAVRVGRQVARGGKLIACTSRISALITPPPEKLSTPSLTPPRISLSNVRVAASPVMARKARLHRLDLTIEPASRVLLLGSDGAGVSTLLDVLAGRLAPSRGSILVDGLEVTGELRTLRHQTSFLGQVPELGHGLTPRLLCGLGPDEIPTGEKETTLVTVGAWRVIQALADTWDQPLAARSLSSGERRALMLGSILIGQGKVWALDRPVSGQATIDRRRLAAVLDRAIGRTLLVGLERPVLPERFDRLLVLRRGRVMFDGTPSAWKQWRKSEKMRKRSAREEP